MGFGDSVADSVNPDEEDWTFTTVSDGTGRTSMVRKWCGKRDRTDCAGEEGKERRRLHYEQRKEDQDLWGAIMKLLSFRVASMRRSRVEDVPSVEDRLDNLARLERKIIGAKADGLSDRVLDGYQRLPVKKMKEIEARSVK